MVGRSSLSEQMPRIGFGDFAQQMMDFLRRMFAILGWESELCHFSTRTNSDKVGASVLMMSPAQSYFGHPCRTRFGLLSISQLGKKAAWQEPLKLTETLPVIVRRLDNLLDC